MTSFESLSILVAVFFSPIFACLITLWQQNRKEKQKTKIALFQTLIAYRPHRKIIANPTYITAFNSIGAIFHDDQKILMAWRSHFDELLRQGDSYNEEVVHRTRVILLNLIGRKLGFSGLEMTDIDRNYYPTGYYNQWLADVQLKQELIQYLKQGNLVYEKLLSLPQIETPADTK